MDSHVLVALKTCKHQKSAIHDSCFIICPNLGIAYAGHLQYMVLLSGLHG